MVTVFQNPFPVPQPFEIALDPGNILNVPNFPGLPYQGGPTPSAHPAVGPQPATFRDIITGILPKKRK